MEKRLTPEQAEVEIKVKEAYRLSVDAANNIYRVLKEPELQEHDDIVTWFIIPAIHTILDAEHRKNCLEDDISDAEQRQIKETHKLVISAAGGETAKHASDYVIETYLKPDIIRVIKDEIKKSKSSRKLIRRWYDNLQVDISLRKETELDKWFLSEIA